MGEPVKTIIVRRGFDHWYYFYLEITAKSNGTTVIIDRRRGERRLGVTKIGFERRAVERRADPPGSWLEEGVMFTAQ